MHGFDSANSPSSLRNHQRKPSSCQIINHQRKCLHGWQMDSTAQKAPLASEIIYYTGSKGYARIRQRKQPLGTQKLSTKLLPRVTHEFDSVKSPCGLKNHQRKLSRCWIINNQRKCFHGWHIDSTAQTAPVASEIINENLDAIDSEIVTESASIMHGFDSSNSPFGLKNFNETASTRDAWIWQRKQPLWP